MMGLFHSYRSYWIRQSQSDKTVFALRRSPLDSSFLMSWLLTFTTARLSFQLITLETTLRLYWRDPRLQVEHLLGNKSGDDYVLLHPDASNFIWFPDIYIGECGMRALLN